MATALGILPWAPGEAEAAAARCFHDWLTAREGGTAGAGDAAETIAALAKVRHFLLTHGAARFVTLRDDELPDDRPVAHRAGWRKRIGRRGDGQGANDWHYCIPPEVWSREVCAGLDATAVARALQDAGYLLPQGAGRLARMERVGLENPVRVYAINEVILAGNRWAEGPDNADVEETLPF